MSDVGDLVAIGRIGKPFGIRGDARVRSLSDVPGRFEGLQEVTLVSTGNRRLITEVTRVRGAAGSYVVGFKAFSNPDEVAAFRGGWIMIPRSESPALPSGQYYESDLIGLRVVAEDDQVLGELEEIWDTGGKHVFVVRGGSGEILVPAAKEIVLEVNVQKRIMKVRALEGLLPEGGKQTDAL